MFSTAPLYPLHVKVAAALASVPGEDLLRFHQRSSCFHWICSDSKWLEPGMERQINGRAAGAGSQKLTLVSLVSQQLHKTYLL